MRRYIFIAFYLYEFILKTEGKLYLLIYRQDRGITLAGILTEYRKKMLGEYACPVFDANEIHRWKEEYYTYPDMYRWYDPFCCPSFCYPHPTAGSGRTGNIALSTWTSLQSGARLY